MPGYPVHRVSLHFLGVATPEECREHPDGADGTWSLLTFDGTPAGGRLAGYGTHGDLVVMREAPAGSTSTEKRS